MIQKDLEVALYAAVREAQRRRHEYITLEHLLYTLCFDKTSAKILKQSGANVDRLKKQLEAFLDEEVGEVFVDVELAHEHLAKRFALAFALRLRLLGAHDVDLPAGELRRQAYVAPAGADCKREVVLVYDDVEACDERPHIDAVLREGAFEAHFVRGDRLGPLANVDEVYDYLDEEPRVVRPAMRMSFTSVRISLA